MVTRDPPYLTIGTFLDVVVKIKIALLSLVWYLPRGSNGNTLCITTTGNVFVARSVILLATLPFLDLVMIPVKFILGKTLLAF